MDSIGSDQSNWGNHPSMATILPLSHCSPHPSVLCFMIMVKIVVNAGTMWIYLSVGIKVPAVLFPITFALRWNKKEKSYQSITILHYSQVIWGMPVPLCNRIWTAYLSQWRICQWLWRRGHSVNITVYIPILIERQTDRHSTAYPIGVVTVCTWHCELEKFYMWTNKAVTKLSWRKCQN